MAILDLADNYRCPAQQPCQLRNRTCSCSYDVCDRRCHFPGEGRSRCQQGDTRADIRTFGIQGLSRDIIVGKWPQEHFEALSPFRFLVFFISWMFSVCVGGSGHPPYMYFYYDHVLLIFEYHPEGSSPLTGPLLWNMLENAQNTMRIELFINDRYVRFL